MPDPRPLSSGGRGGGCESVAWGRGGWRWSELDRQAGPCHGPAVRVRTLGLDVGSKTIGVAISDELGLCAHALATLPRRGTRADVVQVRALCDRWGCTQVVVGLPY